MESHAELCARCRDLLHDTVFSALTVEPGADGKVLRCKLCDSYWYKSPEGHWRYLGDSPPDKSTFGADLH